MMQYNMGRVDRGLRIFAGVVLIGLVFTGPQTPLGWIGLIPLATALIGFCPLYLPIGLDTGDLGERSKDPETGETG